MIENGIVLVSSVSRELFATGLFFLTVVGFLMLTIEAMKLSLLTVFDRDRANYWRGFGISVVVTIGLLLLEMFIT